MGVYRVADVVAFGTIFHDASRPLVGGEGQHPSTDLSHFAKVTSPPVSILVVGSSPTSFSTI